MIGSAGSEEKVRYLLDELGLDAAFNYRDGRSSTGCARPRPTASTSTSTTSAAITSRRRSRRCAGGDGPRSAEPSRSTNRSDPTPGPSNLFQATANNLTLRGFRGSAYQHRLPDVVRELGGWLAEGRLRYRETIIDGLERAPEALMRVLSGDTTGKALVRIA